MESLKGSLIFILILQSCGGDKPNGPANTPPQITSLNSNTFAVGEYQSATITGNANDPDKAPDPLKTYWKVNGIDFGTGDGKVDQLIVSGMDLHPGENTISYRAFDGEDYSGERAGHF